MSSRPAGATQQEFTSKTNKMLTLKLGVGLELVISVSIPKDCALGNNGLQKIPPLPNNKPIIRL